MKSLKTMQKKAEMLAKALDRVDTLASEIEEWAEAHGEDGPDFFYTHKLDSPYEFELGSLLEALELISNN